jgi:uncharacterized protein (TIGR02231 family)
MRTLIFIFLASLPQFIFSQVKVKSNIQDVTIFRRGAQISRTFKLSLKSGKNYLSIHDLPAGIDFSSLQVNIDQKAFISDITYRNDFAQDLTTNPEYKSLLDQEKATRIKLTNEQIIHDTWKEEETLILSNRNVSGEDSGLTASQLASIGDLYRTRLLQVKQNMAESLRRIEMINIEMVKITNQIHEWSNTHATKNTAEVLLTVICDKAIDTQGKLTYYDSRATWTSTYDLRLESLQKPLTLLSKAMINQHTGEDWDQVSVKLTTADPSTNKILPTLEPWFLYFFNPIKSKYDKDKYLNNLPAQANLRGNRDEKVLEEVVVMDGVNIYQTRSEEKISFTEHILPTKLSIPSDTKTHDVAISENSIEASYKHISIPKLDPKAYLTAEVIDWEQYNLSNGNMKLYFENTFVGESYLDVTTIDDTLALSLGPDIAISVKKELLKDVKKSNLLSTKREEKLAYNLIIKNNKQGPIKLDLLDQLPIMTDASMELEIEEISGAQYNKETGELSWNLTVKPGEQITKKIMYSVKIPKDKMIKLK